MNPSELDLSAVNLEGDFNLDALLGLEDGTSPVPTDAQQLPLTGIGSVAAFIENFGNNSPDGQDVGNQVIVHPPTLENSVNFARELTDRAFEWFLIRVDSISIYTYFLCAENCAPGKGTGSLITASIKQAIQMVRRLQFNPQVWNPERVGGKLCTTDLKDHDFRAALRAEIVLSRDILFQTAYDATRKLLAPSGQQLAQFVYPRCVLLQGLDDVETASSWAAADGSLVWDDKQGFAFFHLNAPDSHGYVGIVWFGRPEIREFLHHFFCESRSIGFIDVYQLVQNDLGRDEWVDISHATDPMLAFGLAWIAAVVDADVLRNKRFTDRLVTKRRRQHFMDMYHRILRWLQALRNGTIPGLSLASRAQALTGLDQLSELSLPDLTGVF